MSNAPIRSSGSPTQASVPAPAQAIRATPSPRRRAVSDRPAARPQPGAQAPTRLVSAPPLGSRARARTQDVDAANQGTASAQGALRAPMRELPAAVAAAYGQTRSLRLPCLVLASHSDVAAGNLSSAVLAHSFYMGIVDSGHGDDRTDELFSSQQELLLLHPRRTEASRVGSLAQLFEDEATGARMDALLRLPPVPTAAHSAELAAAAVCFGEGIAVPREARFALAFAQRLSAAQAPAAYAAAAQAAEASDGDATFVAACERRRAQALAEMGTPEV